MSSAIEERSFIFAEPDLYEMVPCHRHYIAMRTNGDCKKKMNEPVEKAQAPAVASTAAGIVSRPAPLAVYARLPSASRSPSTGRLRANVRRKVRRILRLRGNLSDQAKAVETAMRQAELLAVDWAA